MPRLELFHPVSLPPADSLARMKQFVAREGYERFAAIEWTTDGGSAKGTGFTGKVQVAADRVAVLVDFSLALLPLRARIEQKIKDALARCFS